MPDPAPLSRLSEPRLKLLRALAESHDWIPARDVASRVGAASVPGVGWRLSWLAENTPYVAVRFARRASQPYEYIATVYGRALLEQEG